MSFSKVVAVTFRRGKEIAVYPNPAKGVMYVSGMSGGETVSLYTVFGQLIWSEKIAGKGTHQLSLAGLVKGVYYVKVNKESKETKSFKLFVE